MGDGRGGARRVEAELDVADRGRVGVDLVVKGDLGDPLREVDVLLGHPFNNEFGAFVVAGRWRCPSLTSLKLMSQTDRQLGWWPMASPASPTAATNRTPVPKSSIT